MPCYDGRPNNEIVYRDNPEDKKQIGLLTDVNKFLEAGLCALITELENRGIADEIISDASKKGVINLMGFWAKHTKEDYVRLSNELQKFSQHEQDVLRKLLNK